MHNLIIYVPKMKARNPTAFRLKLCSLIVVSVVNVDDLVDRGLLAVLLDEPAPVALRLQLRYKVTGHRSELSSIFVHPYAI